MTSYLSRADTDGSVSDKGMALVMESDPFSFALLSASLNYLGYQLLTAHGHEDALQKLSKQNVTLIVIDISDIEFDWQGLSKKIKQFSQDRFLPILCLTEEQDEEQVLECIAAGADDYILKPFSVFSLKSRLLAMEKSRALHLDLERKHSELIRIHDEVKMDQGIAKRIFQRLITDRNILIPQVEIQQRAATIFCGDLVLSAFLPNGGVRVLVGDFTGHGLAAALGAIPVSNIFHAMTYKGIGDYELIVEINRKLHELLPTDLFMAISLISWQAGTQDFAYWNGGMPPLLLVGETGIRELKSFNLPLGIAERVAIERQPIKVDIDREDRIVILSDGVAEAENSDGEMLGDDAIFEAVSKKKEEVSYLLNILERLDEHTLGAPQGDDVTGVEIALWELATKDKEILAQEQHEDYWAWKITLENDRLAAVLPVQNLLRESGLLTGYEAQITALESIVGELYNNALEHGILRLDSRMKEMKDGFAKYYHKRELLLGSPIRGSITLALGAKKITSGKQIVVTVTDSGAGFDYSKKDQLNSERGEVRPWGRGLTLVEQLSDSLKFSGYGNVVTAVYTCKDQ